MFVFLIFLKFLKKVLKKAFETFAQGKDFITPDMVASILRMMGTAFTEETLKETIAEIDEDGINLYANRIAKETKYPDYTCKF